MQDGGPLDRSQLHEMIATEIGVPVGDVEMMDGRLSGTDYSLNATQASDEDGREWIDVIEDEDSVDSQTVEEAHDQENLRNWLLGAMDGLWDREKFIVKVRQVFDERWTLESLGLELGLSKERVRQIEAAAFTKMRRFLDKNAREVHNFLWM